MTKEEKELLIKDICARLPYKTYIEIVDKNGNVYDEVELDFHHINTVKYDESTSIRLYLRPMSSMTEEERNEISKKLNYEFYVDDEGALCAEDDRHRVRADLIEIYIDWLNKKMFDYRGLIEKGLALEAHEGIVCY